MDVCVLTRDLIFYTAAEGGIGASGHAPRQADTLEQVGNPDLVIADFVSFAVPIDDLLSGLDPERITIFCPHERTDIFASGRAAGARVFRRGALARELPRILAEATPAMSEVSPDETQ